jgi:6-phosphogluconolactonase
MREIEAFATRHEAAAAAASAVMQSLSKGVTSRGFASFAGAGGTTPCETYRIMSQTVFDWSRVAVTVTDDQMEPPSGKKSRAGVIGRHLLSARTYNMRFFPLWSASANSQSAAFAANEAIRPLAPFDAALVGMDANGGIAQLCGQSTLPAEAMQPQGRQLVVSAGRSGLSLSLMALCTARLPVLLAFGSDKLATLHEACERDLPVSQLMRNAPLRVLWAA